MRVRACTCASDFDLEDGERHAEIRLEEVIQHLRPLRFGIVPQEARGRAGRERAVAVEAVQRRGAVEHDAELGGRGGAGRGACDEGAEGGCRHVRSRVVVPEDPQSHLPAQEYSCLVFQRST